jgi:hypothetical protein
MRKTGEANHEHLTTCTSVHLYCCTFVHVYTSASVHLRILCICTSVHITSVHLYICTSVHLQICLSEHPYIGLPVQLCWNIYSFCKPRFSTAT